MESGVMVVGSPELVTPARFFIRRVGHVSRGRHIWLAGGFGPFRRLVRPIIVGEIIIRVVVKRVQFLGLGLGLPSEPETESQDPGNQSKHPARLKHYSSS